MPLLATFFSLIRSFFEFFDKERSAKQAFMILTAIMLVALFPLIRANFNYIDDLGRTAEGYREWCAFGRYLSDFFSILVHSNTVLSDISPLPQLLAVFILAFSGLVAIRIVSGKNSYSLWQIVATLPMFLSPWYLECLSYKFDSPYMAISVLASIYPMTLYQECGKKYFVALFCGTLVVCTTYQVSLAFTMVFFCFLFLQQIIQRAEKRVLRRYVIVSLTGIATSLLFFKIFLMPELPNYVNPQIPDVTDLVQNIYRNLAIYLKWMFFDLDKHHRWICLSFLLISLFIYSVCKNSLKNKKRNFILTICTVCCMYLCSFGIYPVMKEPLFYPRAMYGLGMFIALICLYLASYQKIYLAKLTVIVLSWTFIVFACVYGNALCIQSEYTNFRIQTLLNDLNSLPIFHDCKERKILLNGSIGKAPAIQKSMDIYPVLHRLIPETLYEKWTWGQYKFFNYYGLKNIHRDDDYSQEIKKYPILKDTMYHTITGEGDHLVIYLK